MDWSSQFRITENFKIRAANTVEFVFGVLFLVFALFLFGEMSRLLADIVRPGHSFENEYSLMKVVPYFFPFVCGIALTVYSYINGLMRKRRFALRSKIGLYVFLSTFLPVFLPTAYLFVLYFYLVDEGSLIQPPVMMFYYDSNLTVVLFGLLSIGLSIYVRNKFCSLERK
jgi:Na+-driven multidrug efflux pump